MNQQFFHRPSCTKLTNGIGHFRSGLLLTGAALCLLANPSIAVTELERGQSLPHVSVKSTSGDSVDLADPHGQIRILVFADSSQASFAETVRNLQQMVCESPIRALHPMWVLVLSKNSDPSVAAPLVWRADGCGPTIIHDNQRTAFGAISVMALPSIIVMDSKGVVVHALAGPVPRLADIVAAAVEYAGGQISEVDLELVIHPVTEPEPPPEIVRAKRQMHMGDRLMDRGMPELALKAYEQAAHAAPEYPQARFAYGQALMSARQYKEATQEFAAIPPDDPLADAAFIYMLTAQLHISGTDLDALHQSLQRKIERHPDDPLAYAALGLFLSKRGDTAGAMKNFRQCIDLLAEQRQKEQPTDAPR